VLLEICQADTAHK